MGLFFKKKSKPVVDNAIKAHFSYDFKMVIDDVFMIAGRGTIVVGQVETGACREGEEVTIERGAGMIVATSKIIGLEAFHQRLDIAYAGQHVGIVLAGVKKEDLCKGDIITIRNACMYS